MNTDRELLELAAKAVGIEGYIHEWINGPEFIIPGENPVTWNPLRDDGDAFRLAVKLKLSFEIEFDRVNIYKDGALLLTEFLYEQPKPTCIFTATRRAIVQVAAKIGESI